MEKLTKGDGYYRRMTVSHKAFPRLYDDPEISIGYDHVDGGMDGEFTIKWHNLGQARGKKSAPRLEVFGDAWRVLVEHFADLLELLRELDSKDPTPDELATKIMALGDITDNTIEYLEQAEQAPPHCDSCGQARLIPSQGAGLPKHARRGNAR